MLLDLYFLHPCSISRTAESSNSVERVASGQEVPGLIPAQLISYFRLGQSQFDLIRQKSWYPCLVFVRQ